MEYYKLEKTFDGAIDLQKEPGVFEPAGSKAVAKPEEKSPLDEIIEKINEQYKGNFTEADKVLITALHTRLMSNQKLVSVAQSSDPQIFTESIFPKAFGDAAQDSYMEAQETYESLFADQAKYNVIMKALADVVYRDSRRAKDTQATV